MDHRSVAYALLRVTLGVVFLFFGVGKFAGGIANFAGGMNEHFSGKLPSMFVLPFAEVILGTLILIGLGARIALGLSGLLLIGLTFGTVMLGDAPTVAHNLQYAFINFVLLWFCESNAFSVDSLIRRQAFRPINGSASPHTVRHESEVIR